MPQENVNVLFNCSTTYEAQNAGTAITFKISSDDKHHKLIELRFLRPTWHKIGHFRDVPQANLLVWYGKTKPNTTKAHIHQSKEMYHNTK